jgi:dipeptidyl aminopeptidase/acylaminoacyl peptidase
VAVVVLSWAWGSNAQGTKADYERAASLQQLFGGKVARAQVQPQWIGREGQFWYMADLGEGKREFVRVDPAKGERRLAFDHAKLAAALAKAGGKEARGDRLAIDRLDFPAGGKSVSFSHDGSRWTCDLESYAVTKGGAAPPAPAEAPRTGRFRGQPNNDGSGSDRRRPSRAESPDGKWEALVKQGNLYLRDRSNKEEAALSSDAKADEFYEARFYWSPDSTRLLALRTHKVEERKVNFVESSPKDQLQPKLHTINYAKPGDPISVTKPRLFDVASRKEIPIKDDLFATPWSVERYRWSADSSRFTFLYNQRGHQAMRVIAVDAKTGEARAIVNEEVKTFIDWTNKVFLQFLGDDQLVWMSERDGWNHLYLYDANTGEVKNQITKGDWLVRGVERVDEEKRQVWFRACGIDPVQDPYHVHFCRINLDGTGLTRLTEGDGTHRVEYSPDGKYLVDTYARADAPPTIEVRSADEGKLVCVLEGADVSHLKETGWQPPERFVAKGRDGKTDIYGVIFRPMKLDPAKKYPVIEDIYAGPQGHFVPKDFAAFRPQQALAELGFIIVKIDGMGTNWRSKAFHDVCWHNLGDAGFPDRIAWMKAAAAKYPYIDISRVGVFGGSAGGQNALGAVLFHGEFYKAASADCGCHDNRMDKMWWNEQWMGYPVGPHYAEQSNVTNASKLTGKVLLMVGEMDTNVDPASTMQVVNALIKADKDFELVVFPGANHGAGASKYGVRRRNDFFVRNLLGVEPRREG